MAGVNEYTSRTGNTWYESASKNPAARKERIKRPTVPIERKSETTTRRRMIYVAATNAPKSATSTMSAVPAGALGRKLVNGKIL